MAFKQYKQRDFITHEELTADNALTCLDGYLRQIKDVDRETVTDLLFYLNFALSEKDYDLLRTMLWRIIEDFDCLS